MKIIGIDPGKDGAIVMLDSHTDEKMFFLFPKQKNDVMWHGVYEHFQHLKQFPSARIYLEKVASRPGQGVASMFKFGHNFGMLHAFAIATGHPLVFVPPQVWTRDIHTGLKSDLDPKTKSIQAAMNLAPTSTHFFKAHKDVKNFHPGIVDAFLIALYAKRREMNLVVSN